MAEDEKFSQPGEDAQAPSPKRKAKRGWIIGGVVAAVIVVAGAGFWVWHETPSFCNAIYVDTYYSGDQGMLVTAHAEAGNNCLSCHEPVITEQVGEAMKWVADDYPMTADGTKLADGADMAVCAGVHRAVAAGVPGPVSCRGRRDRRLCGRGTGEVT